MAAFADDKERSIDQTADSDAGSDADKGVGIDAGKSTDKDTDTGAGNDMRGVTADDARARTVIAFEDVSYVYPGSQEPVLDGVDLEVRQGEYLALLGANGCGKSTMLMHMNALLAPSKGRVAFDVCGKQLDSANKRDLMEIRRACSMVFQNPDEQTVASTVAEDVAFGPENLGLPQDEIRHRVGESLAKVGLAGFEQRLVFELSRGQRQRVAVAGALAMHPAVLLCDEPTAMLDAQGRRDVMALLQQVNNAGTAVVLVTHDMQEALAADRVVVMEAGRIALEGTCREVFTRQNALRLQQMGLELPAVARYAIEHELKGPLPLAIVELVEQLVG